MRYTCNYIYYTYYKTPNETGSFNVEAKDFEEAKNLCIDKLLELTGGFFDFAIDDFQIVDKSGTEIWAQ
jgi:hypothetical protein